MKTLIRFLYKQSIFNIINGFIKSIYTYIIALLTSQMVDYITNSEILKLRQKLIIYVLFVAAVLLYEFISEILYQKSDTKNKQKCNLELYKLLSNQPVSKIENLGFGYFKQVSTNDLEQICNFIKINIPQMICGTVTSFVYFYFILRENRLLALILLLIGFLQSIPPLLVKNILSINYDKTREIEAKITNFIISCITGLSTIKIFSLEKWILSQKANLNKNYLTIGVKSEITMQIQQSMENFVSTMITFGTYLILGYFVFYNKIDLSLGLVIVIISSNLFSSLNNVFICLNEFFITKVSLKRFNKLLSVDKYLVKKDESIENIFDEVNTIRLNNMSFSHDLDKIFDKINLNIDITNGKKYLITGDNGVGKTTFINILTKIYTCDEIGVFFDDKAINDIADMEFRKNICILLQEDLPMCLTPSEIVSYLDSNNEFNKKYFYDLLSKFGICEELLATNLLCNFSGGQRKKIFLSIALSLVKKIYILDEPTNSLDTISKQILVDYLTNLNKVIFIISHDNEISKICDYKINISKNTFIVEEVLNEKNN